MALLPMLQGVDGHHRPPRLFASVEAFVPPPASVYEEGVACATLPRVHRNHPHIKDTHFIATARHLQRSLRTKMEYLGRQ